MPWHTRNKHKSLIWQQKFNTCKISNIFDAEKQFFAAYLSAIQLLLSNQRFFVTYLTGRPNFLFKACFTLKKKHCTIIYDCKNSNSLLSDFFLVNSLIILDWCTALQINFINNIRLMHSSTDKLYC